MHVGLVLSPCDRLHIDTPGYVRASFFVGFSLLWPLSQYRPTAPIPFGLQHLLVTCQTLMVCQPDSVLQRQVSDLRPLVKRPNIVERVRLHFFYPPVWEYPISVSCRVGD